MQKRRLALFASSFGRCQAWTVLRGDGRVRRGVRPSVRCLRVGGPVVSDNDERPDVLGSRWEWDEPLLESDDDVDDDNKDDETFKAVLSSSWSDLATVRRATAALRPYCLEERYEHFARVAAMRTSRVAVGFERPSNPNNVWACLRTVDAVGVQDVDLVLDDEASATRRSQTRKVENRPPGKAFTLRRSAMVTAMGSQKWLTLAKHESSAAMCASLKARGFTVVATDLDTRGAKSIDDLFPPHEPSCPRGGDARHAIIFGNEEVGISDELRAHADARCYVPMRGFADSFNLSVAAASVLGRLDARGYLEPDLSPADQEILVLTWLLRSVKASRPILQRAGIDLPEHHFAGKPVSQALQF
mmetsp:Transcript_22570/g.72625  ORF Transcript_22570/g.72625 Transcript_22570/m.72625 type:complete len:359 (+) Transcript_22570:78-1154(+)